MERFNLKKLNEVEGKEQFRVEVSNRFASLEDLNAEVEINSAWETIRENIKISTGALSNGAQLQSWLVSVCVQSLDIETKHWILNELNIFL
jgi:CRISPR/Cas system CMR-associated protein Cmr3 (group 5 of RAMP superfamily)